MRTANLVEWIGKNDDHWPPPEYVYRRKFEQADETCQGPCHRHLTSRDHWDLDHIVRVRDGGPNRESNLQVLCMWCHNTKTKLENIAAAKANRNFARHHGYKHKKTASRPLSPRRDGTYEYDWRRRCYVKIVRDSVNEPEDDD